MKDRPVLVTVEDTVDGIVHAYEVGTWKSLWSPGITIGSGSGCAIVIESDQVSPVHARVRGRGHHLVVEAEGESVNFLGREIAIGRFGRINGLGAPVAPLGIDRFLISVSVGEDAPREEQRPWWKFW